MVYLQINQPDAGKSSCFYSGSGSHPLVFSSSREHERCYPVCLGERREEEAGNHVSDSATTPRRFHHLLSARAECAGHRAVARWWEIKPPNERGAPWIARSPQPVHAFLAY